MCASYQNTMELVLASVTRGWMSKPTKQSTKPSTDSCGSDAVPFPHPRAISGNCFPLDGCQLSDLTGSERVVVVGVGGGGYRMSP